MKGTLSMGQLVRGNGAAPSSVALTYTVPPAKATTSNSNGKPKEEEKSLDLKLSEAVRDAKIKVLEVRGQRSCWDSLGFGHHSF